MTVLSKVYFPFKSLLYVQLDLNFTHNPETDDTIIRSPNLIVLEGEHDYFN